MSATTLKGERRREALCEAAAALLREEGFLAVTHRAVAARARLPLAATTYYFASRDELVVAAVEHRVGEELKRGRSLVESLTVRRRSPRAMAELVLEVLHGEAGDDARLLTYYEQFLQAARHEGVKQVLRQARTEVDALLTEALRRSGYTPPPVPLARLIAIVDGTVLSALTEGTGQAAPAARAALRELLEETSRG
ncbi:TetR/AcrR family transcriptional regulator [Pyxidicoccus sp. 3LFB2]